MVQPVADRVKDATTTVGSGTSITLSNTAPAGYQTFLQGFGASTDKQICYCISNPNSPYEWEVGLGLYTSSTNTIFRSRVLSTSSGTTTKIELPAGTKDVFCTAPSGSLLVQDNLGTIEIPNVRNGSSSLIQNQVNSAGRVQNTIGFSCITPTLAGQPGTDLLFEAGNSSTTGAGGYVYMSGGSAPGTGSGGDASIVSGDSSAGDAGTISITGGTAFGGGIGGTIYLYAGGSDSGLGGAVEIIAGDGGTNGGGNISVTAGGASASYTGDGGSISIDAGISLGSGSNGSILLTLATQPAITIQPADATTTAAAKIGLFNATPVVRPTTANTTASTFVVGSGTALNTNSTYAGGSGNTYTFGQVVAALVKLGILT